MAAKVHWKEEPEERDYPAAENYLSLVVSPTAAKQLASHLRRAKIAHWQAKDLLRASRLPLLPPDNVHVASDLKKVRAGKLLSPVLLVRGRLAADVVLTVADGYHR